MPTCPFAGWQFTVGFSVPAPRGPPCRPRRGVSATRRRRGHRNAPTTAKVPPGSASCRHHTPGRAAPARSSRPATVGADIVTASPTSSRAGRPGRPPGRVRVRQADLVQRHRPPSLSPMAAAIGAARRPAAPSPWYPPGHRRLVVPKRQAALRAEVVDPPGEPGVADARQGERVPSFSFGPRCSLFTAVHLVMPLGGRPAGLVMSWGTGVTLPLEPDSATVHAPLRQARCMCRDTRAALTGANRVHPASRRIPTVKRLSCRWPESKAPADGGTPERYVRDPACAPGMCGRAPGCALCARPFSGYGALHGARAGRPAAPAGGCDGAGRVRGFRCRNSPRVADRPGRCRRPLPGCRDAPAEVKPVVAGVPSAAVRRVRCALDVRPSPPPAPSALSVPYASVRTCPSRPSAVPPPAAPPVQPACCGGPRSDAPSPAGHRTGISTAVCATELGANPTFVPRASRPGSEGRAPIRRGAGSSGVRPGPALRPFRACSGVRPGRPLVHSCASWRASAWQHGPSDVGRGGEAGRNSAVPGRSAVHSLWRRRCGGWWGGAVPPQVRFPVSGPCAPPCRRPTPVGRP